MSIYKGTELLAGMPDVSGKANTDMDNLSNTGKSLISGLGMPSNRYIDLTPLSAGNEYTMPANGYLDIAYSITSNANAGIVLRLKDGNNNEFFTRQHENVNNYNGHIAIYIPALKGYRIYIDYWNININLFRFIYAEGEPNV